MQTQQTQQPDIDILEQRIQSDPLYYVEDLLGFLPWAKQREIIEAVRDYDEVAVRSCHAIGKSWVASKIVAWYLNAFYNSLVWTTAPTSRQVYNILWREIRSTHENSRTPLGGELLKTRWEMTSKWYAFGFATDTGEQFQGLHSESAHILGVVDEASGVMDAIMEAAESTLTSQFSKLVMFGNPNKKTGYFADAFKRKGVKCIKISAFDTPNFIANGIHSTDDLIKFAEEKGIENAVIPHPHLITPKFAFKILEKYGRDSNNYRIRIEAEFPLQDDNTLITLDAIEKAMNRKVVVLDSDEEVIACDPARFGTDRTAIILRQGKKVFKKIVITKHSTTEVAGKLISLKKLNMKAKIKIDTIGLGAGVYDNVHDWAKENKCEDDIIAVNVAERAVEENEYDNLRTEVWVNMRDFLVDGELPNDEDFKEMADVKYTFTSKGKMKLESKDDMKKRLGRSPDVTDALAISFSEKKAEAEPNIRIL